MDTSALLTQREVAEYFHVTQRTVRRWVATGKLPAVTTPGGTQRYRRADIEALTATQDVAEATA